MKSITGKDNNRHKRTSEGSDSGTSEGTEADGGQVEPNLDDVMLDMKDPPLLGLSAMYKNDNEDFNEVLRNLHVGPMSN